MNSKNAKTVTLTLVYKVNRELKIKLFMACSTKLKRFCQKNIQQEKYEVILDPETLSYFQILILLFSTKKTGLIGHFVVKLQKSQKHAFNPFVNSPISIWETLEILSNALPFL